MDIKRTYINHGTFPDCSLDGLHKIKGASRREVLINLSGENRIEIAGGIRVEKSFVKSDHEAENSGLVETSVGSEVGGRKEGIEQSTSNEYILITF